MLTPRNPLVWVGLAGVADDDNAAAHAWQKRLHWIMVGMALLSLPAYMFDTVTEDPYWHRVATLLDIVILAAFSLELLVMVAVSAHPIRYVLENWLNIVIIAGSAAAVFGAATEWIPLVRMMRVALGGMVLMRTFTEFQVLLTRRGPPLLLGATLLTLMGAGALFYWLDPKILSFWDGLWLAFITGATVGYGDLVPTVGPTRLVAVFAVIAGVTLMTLFTASVVSYFMGAADAEARRELDAHVATLTAEIANLRAEVEALRADLRRGGVERQDPGDS
jgi:voltage-gated potassium channel